MMRGMVVQLGEKRCDPALDLRPTGTTLSYGPERVQPALQFHQPAPLALEALIGRSERPPPLHHR